MQGSTSPGAGILIGKECSKSFIGLYQRQGVCKDSITQESTNIWERKSGLNGSDANKNKIQRLKVSVDSVL